MDKVAWDGTAHICISYWIVLPGLSMVMFFPWEFHGKGPISLQIAGSINCNHSIKADKLRIYKQGDDTYAKENELGLKRRHKFQNHFQ